MARELKGALGRQTLLAGAWPRLDQQDREKLGQALRAVVPEDRVLMRPDHLVAYSYDATAERHRPDAVVLVRDAEEVRRVVGATRGFPVPLIARGAATNLSGGTMPVAGGVILAMAGMSKIRLIDWENRRVEVEPGVVNAELSRVLGEKGFVYPPDPSSHRISTLGGNVAENSGGPHCVKYGVTTNHVLGLDVVTMEGELIHVPPAFQEGGLDVLGLLTGSEGTLGIVTALTLAIEPRARTVSTLVATFRRLQDALAAVSAIVAAKITPATLELMDRKSIEIVERFSPVGYPAEADAVLLIEADGNPEDVERESDLIARVTRQAGAFEVRQAKSTAEAEALWRGRRAHYGATARLAPHLWVQDVTVPRPRLADMMHEVLRIADRYRLTIVTAAHAGDGNLHPTIPYDPNNTEEVSRMRAADREILKACVALGGAITGEHGIGVDKVEQLALMYNQDELARMYEIKRAWDPDMRLNPFKAVLDPELAEMPPGAVPAPMRVPNPSDVEEVQEMVRFAVQHKTPLHVMGQGRRMIPMGPGSTEILSTLKLDALAELDRDNLTITVGAGMPAGYLARLLESEGFQLPGLEPFMDDTVGGLVADNAPYWRRSWGRGWRDDVLALEWVDGLGRRLRYGRSTMKNVAGYDMVKLAIGSRGRLGIITQLTLRLRPLGDRRWVGISAPLESEEAVALATRIAGAWWRPDGVILLAEGKSGTRLAMVKEGTSQTLRGEMSGLAGEDLAWEEGIDAWLGLERTRQEHLYEARQQRRYTEGLTRPTQLGEILNALPAGVHASGFPGSGWFQIGGTLSEIRQTPDAGLSRLESAICRVMDPRQIFV